MIEVNGCFSCYQNNLRVLQLISVKEGVICVNFRSLNIFTIWILDSTEPQKDKLRQKKNLQGDYFWQREEKEKHILFIFMKVSFFPTLLTQRKLGNKFEFLKFTSFYTLLFFLWKTLVCVRLYLSFIRYKIDVFLNVPWEYKMP